MLTLQALRMTSKCLVESLENNFYRVIFPDGTDNASVIDVTEADKASWSEIDKPQEGEITG